MDIMQLLKDQLSGQVLEAISGQIGATPQQTESAAGGIFATILGGLAKNASTPEGMHGLEGAIAKDHDGSILDDLLGVVTGNAQPANPRATNGAGILGHIFGDKQEPVAEQVSQSSGLNMQQVMRLMPILAPIVLGLIGKMRNQGTAAPQQDGSMGIGDIASILLGGTQSAAQQHGMGGLLGSVLGQVLGAQQQQGGGNDLLSAVLGQVLGGSNAQQQQQQQDQGGDLLNQVLGGLFKK